MTYRTASSPSESTTARGFFHVHATASVRPPSSPSVTMPQPNHGGHATAGRILPRGRVRRCSRCRMGRPFPGLDLGTGLLVSTFIVIHVQSHLNQKTGPRHGPRPLVPVRAPERGPRGLFKGGKPCAYVYVKAVGFGCVAICVAIGETKRPPTGSSPQSSRGPNFIFVPLQVKECFADDSCRDSPLVPQHDVAHDVFGCR